MKKNTVFLFLLLLSFFNGFSQAFITQWNTGSGTTLRFPGFGTNYTIVVKNASGTPVYTNTSQTNSVPNSVLISSLAAGQNYTIEASNGAGSFQRFHAPSSTDIAKLREVKQWGSINWTTMNAAFQNAVNLQVTATDVLMLPANAGSMFAGCTALTGNSSFNNWHTINATNLSQMFTGALSFDAPVNNWNTINVTNMHSVFEGATAFNQPLNNWKTDNVTDLAQMFFGATAFNQYIGSWKTDKVTTMHAMFSNAAAFNQPIDFNTEPGSWNIGKVITMSQVFAGAAKFNQPVGGWDVSAATTMQGMFTGAVDFNQSLASWNTGNVTTMEVMFDGALKFNQNINSWNTSKVTNMKALFANAPAFNQPIGNWNTGNVTTMEGMFSGASTFNQPINTGTVAGSWDVSKVTNMSVMFYNAAAFNQLLDNWNTSRVVNMYAMFALAGVFNQDIGMWNLQNVSNLQAMLSFSGLDCEHYGKTLKGWSEATATPANLVLGSDNRTYGPAAVPYRDALITRKGWTINGVMSSGDTYDPGCNTSLPVIFGTISAKMTNGQLVVDFTTEQEKNNSHFEIEVSADGKNFTNIGTVKSKAVNGISEVRLDYRFTKTMESFVLGVGLLVLGGLGFARKRKLLLVSLIAAGLSFMVIGCQKGDTSFTSGNKELFVRLVQVDQDGARTYSQTVKAAHQ